MYSLSLKRDRLFGGLPAASEETAYMLGNQKDTD
jgi:hypothetical protein